VKVLHWISGFALNTPSLEHWPATRAALSPAQLEGFLEHLQKGRDELCSQMRARGYWETMTEWEHQLAQTLPCDLSPQQHVDASWCLEALGVLLWAVGRVKTLPAFDTQFAPSILGLVDRVMDGAALRPAAEIEAARNTAELWHWRSRTRELVERGDPFPDDAQVQAAGFHSFDDVVRVSAQHAAQEGTIPGCVADDFPAKGKGYRQLSNQEWSEMRSIALERHRAFNWLCGYAPNNHWDQTPTET
jgi:hypothetical protein